MYRLLQTCQEARGPKATDQLQQTNYPWKASTFAAAAELAMKLSHADDCTGRACLAAQVTNILNWEPPLGEKGVEDFRVSFLSRKISFTFFLHQGNFEPRARPALLASSSRQSHVQDSIRLELIKNLIAPPLDPASCLNHCILGGCACFLPFRTGGSNG